jgi:hypothetical protein
VRQYAGAIGLDSDEIEAELEREKEAEAPKLDSALKHTEFPVKQPDPIVMESNRRQMGTGHLWAYVVLLGAVLAGCTAFYGWWDRMETAAASGLEPMVETVAASGLEPMLETGVSEPEPVPPVAPAAVGAPADEAAAKVVERARSEAGEVKAGTVEDRSVVNLSASEPTWVSVTADGKTLFTGVLSPNETRTLGAGEMTRIRTGNAGGLAIQWNGKNIGPLGLKGQIRTVVLTPDSYRIIESTVSTNRVPL